MTAITQRTWSKDDEVKARLLSHVEEIAGGCWIWTARLDRSGYGRFQPRGSRSPLRAHRVAYELFVGPISSGVQLDHTCHNSDLDCRGGDRCPHRACVNPAHLEPVSHRENGMRGRSFAPENAAKTHCDHGHEYTPENTYHPPKHPQRRDCRKCIARRAREYKQRQAGATS